MKVLAIDTSTYTLGISLLDGEQVIGEYITNLKKNHSLRVMPAIDTLMKECEVKPADLDKIVVAKGPGSYTGVRIGVTIAKTLAWSLNIPLSGVSSLALLAASARLYPSYISPVFDARRGRVYTGLYRFEEGKLTVVDEDQNISLIDWCSRLKELKEEVLFVGQDVLLHEDSIRELLGGQALVRGDIFSAPRPADLARLGVEEPVVDLHSFVPNYIRLAEAEAKWLEQQKADN
ncbi:tRNA (adenosine(37)-N6)-threonylcarbamoyltransferase complex dimerization subunit type 1 TsaB [Pseudobacillus badius]|uniref:tRNA (adenosine(37)-N6)-threonylcarbamoyltransferase complex dimerization subunit type 1 TsaB n=1 Tax=Bacillus badius TaxID=1455 RepID=UPI0007B0533B|nr:tRNA (adenosine(37)-N6)-threonylcarbamoyltransferase complex dimerization subunit type 1 TsaB [Bacillus badius]KZO00890.1 tRNA threonylcarbamoyladenosine biosynthesis protein TsaB [Bacillus badius]MED0665769.1 tRNA (adenosine(37)-N6)-threonylcarbamoyltransferase complex dimerization subunit type 1 TsaB [Bacillus badius]OCS88820.1 tRNA N6-adenosine(37)-N6-threonylcarbamoyltransferase complex dimerization subunit TsaB [Bacillus badius]OVE49626.1 tRNA N6-adenosine(37)-N6-threonylcarbamoyltransf